MKICFSVLKKTTLLTAILAIVGFNIVGMGDISASEKKATVIGEKAETMPWTAKIMELINNGNAKKGAAIAKEHKCKKCHGKTGKFR